MINIKQILTRQKTTAASNVDRSIIVRILTSAWKTYCFCAFIRFHQEMEKLITTSMSNLKHEHCVNLMIISMEKVYCATINDSINELIIL